jgi:predicted alpha/beta hydrolase
MRQLTFIELRKFECWDVAAPSIEGGREAVVEPLAVTRCDLDLYIANSMYPVLPRPFAMGHEVVARIIELGEDVRHVNIGDIVIFPFQISCGSCDQCRRGHTAGCLTVPGALALSWPRWDRHHDYFLDPSGRPLRARFSRHAFPYLFVGFTDDAFAPATAIDALAEFFTNAQVSRWQFRPDELGLNTVGHFGFFRRSMSPILWERVLDDWLMQSPAGGNAG